MASERTTPPDWTRIVAVYRKELREYRRTASIVGTMLAVPIFIAVFPLFLVLALPNDAASTINGDPLLILLGIPALVPGTVAAYAIVGERSQGTLEPLLTTAITREELLLGKGLAALVPTLAISYCIDVVFLVVTALFAKPAVAALVLDWPNVVLHVGFTVLIAVMAIWFGMAISTRTSDARVSQQLGSLIGFPVLTIAYLIAFGVIPWTPVIIAGWAVTLAMIDVLGWLLVRAVFDRERLISPAK